VPCKKEFPHLVQMQQKFSNRGFVVVSVHLNGVEKTAQSFLQKVKADFTNLILDEPEQVWMARLETGAVPTLFLFNKQNRIAQKFIDIEDQAAFEKEISELLDKP
jgi:thiol-disulfide isomerase/thioredoxin